MVRVNSRGCENTPNRRPTPRAASADVHATRASTEAYSLLETIVSGRCRTRRPCCSTGSDPGSTTMALESSVLQKIAAGEPSDPDLLCRIRAEFESMPGLNLTLPQALRLFNID